MNKIAKSVVQGTPVGTGVGMRPETLDLEIDDLYELSSPNVGTYIRRLRPYVSAWEADRKARIEIEQAYSDLQDEHMVLHQELGAAQTRIEALENQKCERCDSELFVRCLVCAGDEPAALPSEEERPKVLDTKDVARWIEALERELGAFVALFDPDRKNLVTAFVRATALAAKTAKKDYPRPDEDGAL